MPQKSGNQALGRSPGGLTTKIHALAEALGQLARGHLTAGQTHDVTQAPELLDNITAQAVVAGKAFDAEALLKQITASGATPVIPPRTNRSQPRDFGKHQYKHRNLIERFFCRIKQFCRIATRYDKLARRFSSFIALVAAFVWLV